jgi:hypothetical protein
MGSSCAQGDVLKAREGITSKAFASSLLYRNSYTSLKAYTFFIRPIVFRIAIFTLIITQNLVNVFLLLFLVVLGI